MKASLKVLFVFTVLAICSMGRAWGATCPTTVNTNTDCGYIITIGPGGVLSGATVFSSGTTPGNPYDGSDDALIGVVNNSGASYTGSFVLTGSGNGGGLFAFDGDGICTYVAASYCATASSGYEGPINTFSGIKTTSVFDDTGTVNITGLAAGGTTYFSLESSPASFGKIIIGGQVPEPTSLLLLATGALGAAATIRRRLNF